MPCPLPTMLRLRRIGSLLLIVTMLVLSPGAGWAALLRVVTTVAPLTDLVRQVGGEAIPCMDWCRPGSIRTPFSPRPVTSNIWRKRISSFLMACTWKCSTEKLARRSGKPGLVFLHLGDRTISKAEWVFDFSFPKAAGHPNPHLWLNVAHAMHYVGLIRDQLGELDPANASVYQGNATRVLTTLEQLDRCISTAIADHSGAAAQTADLP